MTSPPRRELRPEMSSENVATYLETLEQNKLGPAEGVVRVAPPPVILGGLTSAERAVLKVLLDKDEPVPTGQLVAMTALGALECGLALQRLASRSIVEVVGTGPDEQAQLAPEPIVR